MIGAVSAGAEPSVTAAVGILAVLVGSIPFGLLLTRLFSGRDVRASGSGNIGAANVSRVAGARVGAVVLICDVAKGVLVILLGRWLGLNPIDLAIIAGLAVLGHDFSLFLHFKGGKGVATTLGVAAGLAVAPAVAAAAIWVLIVVLTRVSALASLVSLWMLVLFMAVFDQAPEYIWLTFALSLLSVYTHRDNIARISRGAENRVGRV